VRPVGKGRVLYAGTYLTEALLDGFFADELERAGVLPLLADKPEGVEVSLREGPKGKLLFVLNTRHEPVTAGGLPAGKVAVGDAEIIGRAITLPGYGCLVLALD
jgi:beta-galactosidase